ncbi:MAG: hypothetical protein ACLSCQ_04205 [Evtepia gabavorous]
MEAEEKAEWVSLSGQAAGFPWAICPVCGQEQYQEDLPLEEGRCLACRRRARKREEDAMTLREMSVEYRAQAQALRGRMQELEKAWKQTKDPAERANLEGRIWTLEVLWRETRDQAVLLERYYERGYHRNEKYTL